MAKNRSGNAQNNGAHTPDQNANGQDSQAKQKAQATKDEAQHQAQQVAQDAKAQAKDLGQTAQREAGQLKDEAVQQVKSLAGTVQGQVGDQAVSQQERVAGQVRSYTDDLHRLVSGEQPQSDAVRQAVTAVADRAESLTQRLETASPADLLDDVRGFAARKPGTFLALALGAGLVAGRLTRGLRDADQDGATDVRRTAAQRAPQRALEPQGVQSDVTPHHIDSQIPAHTGDDAARPAGQADGLPYGTEPAPTIDPVTGRAVDEPFDQTRQGGRA